MLRAAGVLGSATGISRLLGFARDWLIAVTYGTSWVAQAFVVAFRIPNLLRVLAAEGAANSAFVPAFSRTLAQEGRGSWGALLQAVWFHVVIGFLLVCAVGVAAAPWIVACVAPGFLEEPALYELTVRLTRILFPFLGLVGVSAFLMGALNSVRRFALPSLGPALLNLCMIAGMLAWRPDGLGLSVGVLVGGLASVAVQWPALKRVGVRLGFRPVSHPGVAQIRRLLIPRMAGAAVYQLSVLVDTVFASFPAWVGPGGVAALYFANRFLQLPLGLFGVSLAQAALPTLSGQAAGEDSAAARRTLGLALKTGFFVAVPSAVGLAVLARPIIGALLQWGAFTAEAAALTASAVVGYALGLVALCAAKALVNALYAFGDTWTPVRSAGWALGLNLFLNILLVGPLGLGGLALATSLSAFLNALHLGVAVHRRLGKILPEGTCLWTFKVLAAAGLMGGGVRLMWDHGAWDPLTSGVAEVAWLVLTVLFGMTVFFLSAAALRVEEAMGILRWVWKRN